MRAGVKMIFTGTYRKETGKIIPEWKCTVTLEQGLKEILG